jgi:hypothetical protein
MESLNFQKTLTKSQYISLFETFGAFETVTKHLQIFQIGWLNIQDLPLKTAKLFSFESFWFQELVNKGISILRVESLFFSEEQFTSVFIVVKEWIIHDFLNIGDAITKYMTTIKAEPIALPEAAVKHIAIFKTDALSFLDKITKIMGQFIQEKIVEQIGFKDVIITYAWTPWYNDPVEFMKVILFAFCLVLFTIFIARRL